MKSKSGVELTLNVIIVAVLVLIVLVVLIFIFVNQSREFVIGISSCSARHSGNFKCVQTDDDCINEGGSIDFTAKCDTKEYKCCVLNLNTRL